MTKMPQKYQMTKKKKKPPKWPKYPQNYQIDKKKKYSWNHQSDPNTPKMTKITSIP